MTVSRMNRLLGTPAARAALAAGLLAAGASAAGCFAPPDAPRPEPDAPAVPDDGDTSPAALRARVAAALGGDRELAATYAAFYRLLADRLRAGTDAAAADFAAVAGRAARLLALPGRLSGPAGDRLGGVLNPPGRFTPDRRAKAAAAFDALADACEGALR